MPEVNQLSDYVLTSIDDTVQIVVDVPSQSPRVRKMTFAQLRAMIGSIASRLITGSQVGDATTHLPIYSSQLRVGVGSKDIPFINYALLTWDSGSVAAGGTTTQTVTVLGALAGDMVVVQPDADLDGLRVSARVTAPDTVTVRIYNMTAAPIDPASTNFNVMVLRFV